MPYVPVHGTRLFYQLQGSPGGRPLLLLHAALQTSDSMAPLVELLGPHGYRMVIPDQRGHGRSANPGRTLSIPMLADDQVALMEALRVQRPVVIGYSLGGIVGLELARRGLVSALVVLASRYRTATQARQKFDPADIRRRSPLWAKQLAEKHVEVFWEELAVELGAMLSSWPGFPPEELAAISCPALVVQGDRDEMVPIEQARELASIIPGARLHEVPRAKHPELLYRPDAMRVVHQFVTGLTESAP